MRKFLNYLVVGFLFGILGAQSSAQDDKTLDYELIWQFESKQGVRLVEWHPQASLIAVTSRNYVIFIDSRSGEEVHHIEVDEVNYVTDMAWNNDGSLFAVGDADGWIHIYDDKWEEISLFLAPWFTSLDWHPVRNELATVNNDTENLATDLHDSEIRIWTVEGEIIERLSELSNVISVEYSPDGHYIVGVDWYSNIVLWDTETYNPLNLDLEDTAYRTLSDQHFAQSIAWSTDNEQFALISNNNMEDTNSYVIWDIATKKMATGTVVQESFLNSLSWNSELDMLASAGSDGAVRIWDTSTFENVLTIEDTESVVTSVAWSPDGRLLASAGWDGSVRLWEIKLSTNV